MRARRRSRARRPRRASTELGALSARPTARALRRRCRCGAAAAGRLRRGTLLGEAIVVGANTVLVGLKTAARRPPQRGTCQSRRPAQRARPSPPRGGRPRPRRRHARRRERAVTVGKKARLRDSTGRTPRARNARDRKCARGRSMTMSRDARHGGLRRAPLPQRVIGRCAGALERRRAAPRRELDRDAADDALRPATPSPRRGTAHRLVAERRHATCGGRDRAAARNARRAPRAGEGRSAIAVRRRREHSRSPSPARTTRATAAAAVGRAAPLADRPSAAHGARGGGGDGGGGGRRAVMVRLRTARSTHRRRAAAKSCEHEPCRPRVRSSR